jgi:hypothetical protein
MNAINGTIDSLALAVWPAIIVVAFLVRSKPHPVIGVAALLAGLLLVIILIYSFHHTAAGLANGYIFAIVLGVLFVFVRRKNEGTVTLVLRRAIGAMMLTYGCWYLVGDFLLRRTQVDGLVARVDQGRSSYRSGDWRYFVEVGARRFETTKEVYQSVEPGQRVRADVGKGSGKILAVERIPL